MGKHKIQRKYKLHSKAPSSISEVNAEPERLLPAATHTKQSFEIKNNGFEGVDNVFKGLDLSSMLPDLLKKEIADDTVSVKSFASRKSVKEESIIPKKEKRKLRRQMLLRKLDTVNQLRKEIKLKKKKISKTTNNSFSDMKSLLDCLPTKNELPKKIPISSQYLEIKKKPIKKTKKIQKTTIKHVNIYKKLLKNDALKKNPFEAISQHLKAVVEFEKKAVSKSGKESCGSD